MMNETQMKKLDATLRTIKAKNRTLTSLSGTALVEMKESLSASNVAIQAALDNGNYENVAVHTAGAKAAAKKISDFDGRRETAEADLSDAIDELRATTFLDSDEEDAVAAEADEETEATDEQAAA